MGRKPKNHDMEGIPLPLTEVEEIPPKEIEEYISDDNYLKSVESAPTITFDGNISVYKKNHDIEDMISNEMDWAYQEILRCNDYVFAKADYDRRFSTYRDELYEYRYKLRQLSLLPSYPDIPASALPTKPDYIPDV